MATAGERTHYQVLGVGPDSGPEEIRRAHRQLARVLHPDRQAGSTDAERRLAERRMREVNEAWSVLSDGERRRDYDRSLRAQRTAASSARPRPTAASAPPSSTTVYGRTEDVDLDDPTLWAPDEQLSPAHFWLLRRGPVLAAVLVAVLLFFVTAYAGGSAVDGERDDVARTSVPQRDCVRRVEGRTSVRVGCNEANDGRIMTRVDRPLDCPAGTSYVLLENRVTCVTSDPSMSSNLPPEPGGDGG